MNPAPDMMLGAELVQYNRRLRQGERWARLVGLGCLTLIASLPFSVALLVLPRDQIVGPLALVSLAALGAISLHVVLNRPGSVQRTASAREPGLRERLRATLELSQVDCQSAARALDLAGGAYAPLLDDVLGWRSQERPADWLLYLRGHVVPGLFWGIHLALQEGTPPTGRLVAHFPVSASCIDELIEYGNPERVVEIEFPEDSCRLLLDCLGKLPPESWRELPISESSGCPCDLVVLRRQPFWVTRGNWNVFEVAPSSRRYPPVVLTRLLCELTASHADAPFFSELVQENPVDVSGN